MKFLSTLLKYLGSILALLILLIYGTGGGIGTPHYDYPDGDKMQFAHRGCCQNLPRNSMAAFDRAVAQNLAIETDVRMTKDGKLVLFHDDTTSLKLNLNGSIAQYTYAHLRNNPFIQHGKATSHYLVTLDSLMYRHANTPLYLDLKTPSKKVADSLVHQLTKLRNENYLIADANIVLLAYLKWKNPTIKTVWEGFDAGKEWTYHLIPKKYKPNYLASFRDQVTESHLAWLQDNDLLKAKIVYGKKGSEKIPLDAIPHQMVECE